MESGVRRATGDDAAVLSRVLADALLNQRLGACLVPDAAERPAVLRRYARLVVVQGLAHGQVDTTDDRAAGAIWYSRPATPPASAQLGYVPRSPILLEPGGPVLWRMWRPPARAGRPGDAAGDALPARVRAERTAIPFRGALLLTASPRSP